MNNTIGNKLQRKGSQIVWVMVEACSPASGSPVYENQLHIKSITGKMAGQYNWISLDSINKNWVEVL